jgi:Tfp pilus assembly protein FimT
MGWRCNLLGRAEGRLLPMMYMIHRGFTLIELLVTMTIGIPLLMAMPQMALWMSGIDVRVGAQSVAEGMRKAQATANSRNLNSQFALGSAGWIVQVVDNENIIDTAPFVEGSRDVTFNAVDVSNSAATTVTFNPLGQVIANATNIAKIDVTGPSAAGTRSLRVIVGTLSGGSTFYGVKLCDPAFPSTDPKGCP